MTLFLSWVCATTRCDNTISNQGQSYCNQCGPRRERRRDKRAADRKARAAGYDNADHQAEQEAAMAWATGREERDALTAQRDGLLAALKSMLVVYARLKSGEVAPQEWQQYEQDAADAHATIAKAGGAT